MAAWESKSPHKLHCYLGQTSVSKHTADLKPQLWIYSVRVYVLKQTDALF